jgi:type I restriction enzyme S subunit
LEGDFKINTIGMGIPHVDGNYIRESKIIFPPLHEQNQIVSYLDTKTSQIDSLIEKTQRKIELLKEKRTSLINEVVTKGLNPNVEMKDSGVEWIGKIPSHWEVKRLKYVSDVKPSNVDKHIFPDEVQVELCNYTDVYYNEYLTKSTKLKIGSCTPIEFEKFKLIKDDVIITKDSESPDDIGVPCLVMDNLDNVVCGYHLTLIRPIVMRGGFIFRFIQSDRTRRYYEIESNGITRYGLGKYSIENMFIPSPPLNEQEDIESFLEQHTQLIDKTIFIEERRIELLKEYRQSLISEVVTGKRKVVND